MRRLGLFEENRKTVSSVQRVYMSEIPVPTKGPIPIIDGDDFIEDENT